MAKKIKGHSLLFKNSILMPNVSLTDLCKRFLQNCPDAGGDALLTGNSEKFLGDAIRLHCESFSQSFSILVTVCESYARLKELLDAFPNAYDFLIDYTRRAADRLASENKLNPLLLAKNQVSVLEEEIRHLDSDQALIDALPVSLSYIVSGRFASKFADTLNTLGSEKQTAITQKAIDRLRAKKQSASSLLEALASAHGYLESKQNELQVQQSLQEKEPGADGSFSFGIDGEAGVQHLHDRAVRVFLFIESYRQLCTEDSSFNGRLACRLMGLLRLNIA